jgi:hypothetical protein
VSRRKVCYQGCCGSVQIECECLEVMQAVQCLNGLDVFIIME